MNEDGKTYDGLPLRPDIRSAVRALILRDGAVLVQHKVYDDGREKYTLPGGGVDAGETLTEALAREVCEEIGTDIEVLSLLHVIDVFKRKNGPPPVMRHQIDHVFLCTVPDDYEARNGPAPDKDQKAVLWLALDDLEGSVFAPVELVPVLLKAADHPVYLGRIG